MRIIQIGLKKTIYYSKIYIYLLGVNLALIAEEPGALIPFFMFS